MKNSKSSRLCGILFVVQICVADSAKRKEKQFVVFIVAAHLKTRYHRLVKTMCTFVCLFVCFCFNIIFVVFSWLFNGRTCMKNQSASIL